MRYLSLGAPKLDSLPTYDLTVTTTNIIQILLV